LTETEIKAGQLSADAQDVISRWKESSADYIRLMAYYKCAMMEIETKFNVLNQEFTLQYDRNPISNVKSRLKSPESIVKKLQRKNLPVSIASIAEELNDIAGVRVVCSFREDVYMLAEALLKQDDIILIEKKDYISNPKDNGYRSLHLIVSVPIFLSHEKKQMKVEIQLRTIAMDFWATLEHQLRYKKDIIFTPEMSARLYQCAEISAAMDAGMDSLLQYVQSGIAADTSAEHKDDIQTA